MLFVLLSSIKMYVSYLFKTKEAYASLEDKQ